MKTKRKELQMGINGFLTYDIGSVPIFQGSLFSNSSDPDLPPPVPAACSVDENAIFTNQDLLKVNEKLYTIRYIWVKSF